MALTIPFNLPNNADENLKKLFTSIERYNSKPSLVRLQLIEAQRAQMHKDYLQNPPPYVNDFLRWSGRDPVRSELLARMPENERFTNTRLFEMSAQASEPINFEKLKRDLKNFKYKKEDGLLAYRIEQTVQKIIMTKQIPEIKGANPNQHHQIYLASLRELKILALAVIASSPESKSTFKKFSKLVDQLNYQIEQEIITMSHQENPENIRSSSPVPPVQEKIGGSELADFIKQLDKDQNFALDNFEFIALGGKNNKNWIARNIENDERFIVRLEKENNRPSEFMVEKIQKHPAINNYLAEDYLSYPAQIMDGYFAKEYNIVISEFCPKKDLLSFRYELKDETDEVIIDKVLAATEQVASFSQVLNINKLAYTDIKPENFLLRGNEEVVTADKKSIVNQGPNNEIRLIGQGSVPVSFKMPEFSQYASDNGTAKAEAFMVYEIGVMLHVLMIGDKENKPHGTASYVNQNDQIDFNFDHPIYNTVIGEKIKELVQAATNPDPEKRIPLSELIETCQALKIENRFEQSAPDMDRDSSHLRPLVTSTNISNDNSQNLKDSLNAVQRQDESESPDDPEQENKDSPAPF